MCHQMRLRLGSGSPPPEECTGFPFSWAWAPGRSRPRRPRLTEPCGQQNHSELGVGESVGTGTPHLMREKWHREEVQLVHCKPTVRTVRKYPTGARRIYHLGDCCRADGSEWADGAPKLQTSVVAHHWGELTFAGSFIVSCCRRFPAISRLSAMAWMPKYTVEDARWSDRC